MSNNFNDADAEALACAIHDQPQEVIKHLIEYLKTENNENLMEATIAKCLHQGLMIVTLGKSIIQMSDDIQLMTKELTKDAPRLELNAGDLAMAAEMIVDLAVENNRLLDNPQLFALSHALRIGA